MKPEQALRQLIKPYLPGIHWRIENAAGVGMPDIFGVGNAKILDDGTFIPYNFHYWLELKVSKKFGFIELDNLVTRLQKHWHWQAAVCGQQVFVLIKTENMLELAQCKGDGVYALLWKAQKTNTWDWKKFKEILTNA